MTQEPNYRSGEDVGASVVVGENGAFQPIGIEYSWLTRGCVP